jgi:hypothetical protein
MKKAIPFILLTVLSLASCKKMVIETIDETIIKTTVVMDTIYQTTVVKDTVYIKDTVIVDIQAYSIQSFGVLPTNTPRRNRLNLQEAINWASSRGAALFVEPVEGGYPVQSGIALLKNVSLIGVHGPTGRGTAGPNGPTGSLFVITDTNSPFITVESATQVSGCQFYYPKQAYKNSDSVIEYPPTIKVSQATACQGVTLRCLTFYGETFAMDFEATRNLPCEQILFEHCYGYPLSGKFISIDHCYDIPRILHCHVNPANQREFGRGYPSEICDYVIKQKNYTYTINHTDNAQCIDLFTFGNYGGIYLGPQTYGQLTNFNLDCVCIGVLKDGDGPFNRVWEVAQGSIIANASPDGKIEDIHPFYVRGKGHLNLTNVDCFSGNNPAVTGIGNSYDFMTIDGTDYVVVTGVNCRMRNYRCDNPINVNNPKAQVSFINCANKNGDIFNYSFGI